MVFSDQAFLFVFLPIVLSLGLALKGTRLYIGYLLAMSLVFYYWTAGYQTLILIASILWNFAGGLVIERTRSKAWLAAFVAVNVLALAYYKYAFFVASNFDLEPSSPVILWLQHLVLPIGISFFTFQAISYLVDVYRGDVPAERSLIVYGAFKAFFPQLIAGPVIRYVDVKADFLAPRPLDETFGPGIRRFAHGLVKKLLIADTVAVVADAAFAVPADQVTFAVAALGAIAYTLQIYFDFSGYTDMAIGLGLMFGIRFAENFRHPYSASSITEFWRRWHISLSQWFRDYVYIPLGGNKASALSTYRNLIIVFAVTGLWHGAAWTFVIWGLYHGAFLILERLVWGKAASDLGSFPLRLFYCIPVVVVGWIFFRAENLDQAFTLIAALATPWAPGAFTLPASVVAAAAPLQVIVLLAACAIFLAPGASTAGLWAESEPKTNAIAALQITYLALGLGLATVLSLSSSFSPFLYFRF